jgi:hypothetical protein
MRDKDGRGVAVVVLLAVVALFETDFVGEPEVVGATVCPAEQPASTSAPRTTGHSFDARLVATKPKDARSAGPKPDAVMSRGCGIVRPSSEGYRVSSQMDSPDRRPRRRRLLLMGTMAMAILPLALIVVFISGSASPSPARHPTATAHNLVVRRSATTAPRANVYPANACEASEPTSLLLPARAIPNMELVGGSAAADGGQSLAPMGLGRSSTPSSAAVIQENLFDTKAPKSALQSDDPFNTANPHVITSFSEGITGFTVSSSEAEFWGWGTSEANAPPQYLVDGHLMPVQVALTTDDPDLPVPNDVVVLTAPQSDVDTQITFSVKAGHTVIGLAFFGGVGLSLKDVMPIAMTAMKIITSACRGGDIMAGGTRRTAVKHFSSDVAECAPSDLAGGDPGWGSRIVETDSSVLAMALMNSSSVPCSLAGYPAITWQLLVNETPPETPDTAAVQTDEAMPGTYGPGFVPSAGPTDPVVIEPGHSAAFYLMLEDDSSSVASSDACANTLDTASVSFPGWSTPLPLGSEGLPTCPGNPFWVSPVGLEGSSPFPPPLGLPA